jgi:hypothetical protein
MANQTMNCIDRYIYAQESQSVNFNSYFVAEFEKPLEEKRLYKAIVTAYKKMPSLRTKISDNGFYPKRKIMPPEYFNTELLLDYYEEDLDENQHNNIKKYKFDFNKVPAFKFYAFKGKDRFTLILCVHHCAFDGFSQGVIVQEVFKAYDGEELNKYFHQVYPFKYRYVYFKKGLLWCFKRLKEFIHLLNDNNREKVSTLIKKPEENDRTVSLLEINFSKNQIDLIQSKCKDLGISKTLYLIYNLYKVLDQLLCQNNDTDGDILLYVPKDQRRDFKAYPLLQNIIGVIWIKCTREEIRSAHFVQTLKDKYRDGNKLEQTSRATFFSGILSTILPHFKLKKLLRKKDTDPNYIYSSGFITSGIFPKSSYFPKNNKLIRIYGHGTLLKNPGLGITHLGTVDNEVVIVQYLEKLFDPKQMKLLRDNFEQSILN